MTKIAMNDHWALESDARAGSHVDERETYGVSKWDAVNADQFLIPVIANTLTIFIDEWASDGTPGVYDTSEKWMSDLRDLRDTFVTLAEKSDFTEYSTEELTHAFTRLGEMLPMMWH